MRGAALEDVPTIVPIVLSLVLFFSSVVWALNRVNSVDGDIQLVLDSLRLAQTFTQTSYLTVGLWNRFCDAAKTQFPGTLFAVRVASLEEWNRVRDPQSWLLAGGALECKHPALSTSVPRARRAIVNAFPVLVQTESGETPRNELRVLVVGVWQGA